MKKLICVLLLLCFCLPACAENTFTYQNGIQFGMTLEEVKNLEDARNAGNPWYQSDMSNDLEMQNGRIYNMLVSLQGNYSITPENIGYAFLQDNDQNTLKEILVCCYDLLSASKLRKLDYDAWQNGSVSFERLNSYDCALQDYEILEQSLTQKYGPSYDSDVIVSDYLSEYIITSGYEPENLDYQLKHRLLHDAENVTIIEHFVWYESNIYGNFIIYSQMPLHEYEQRMQQNLIQDYLDNIL